MLALGRFATRVLLGAVSLVASRALFEIAHLYGWYPEQQLARLVRGLLSTEAALWTIVALIAVAIWAGLDFIFYRRSKASAPTLQTQASLPPRSWQDDVVGQAWNSIPPSVLEWLRTAPMGARPPNEEIASALNTAGLIDRDFVGWTGIKSELRDAVAKRVKERGWPKSELHLSIGDSQPFFQTKSTDSHIRRTYNLRLENVGPTALSYCNVMITDIDPPQDVYAPPWRLRDGGRLSLNAGEPVFIAFASYGEAYASGCVGDSFFEFEVEGHAPLPSADKEHIVTVRATARESAPADFKCTLWVENGRFQIAKA